MGRCRRMASVKAKRRSEAGRTAGGLADLAARAWTLAVARAARDELGLPLDLRDVAVERRVLAEVAELLPDPALIAVLDEGQGQATGFAVLDAALTAGMVEALTTGRLAPGGGDLRRPTRTDAAMLSPVLDRAMAGFETALDGVAGHETMRGYRFAAVADGARSLLLMLEEGPYRLLRARGVLGGGLRDGIIMLGLPDRMAPVPARIAPPPDESFARDMAAQVVQASVRLDAVLLRMSLPLGTVLHLSVGQEIALLQADISRISVEGLDGRRVASGQLGQQGGLRAIRIGGEEIPPG